MRNSQTSTSKIPPHVASWLSAEGWTAEELSFVDMYPESVYINEHGQYEYTHEKVKRLMRIHARQETQKGERNREYDSKNKLQRKDPPSWFGEGINRDLFK